MEKELLFQNKCIHYTACGSGPAVVLLHGFGEDSKIWQQQVTYLQNSFYVIAPDLPGSGNSEKLELQSPSIEIYADVIHQLLLAEHIDTCILLGHSMGGYITLAFAAKYPEVLTAFGLIHSTAFADSEEKKETRRKAISFIQDNNAYSFLKTSIPNLFSEQSKTTIKSLVEDLVEKGKSFSKESLMQYYEAMMTRPNLINILSNTPHPVLFVIGTEDMAAHMHDILKQVHLPNTAFIHILEGVGHMSMLEAPGKLNNCLKSFCDSVYCSG